MLRVCKHHGVTEFTQRKNGIYLQYKCNRCAVEAVTKRRRKVKRTLIEAAGGKCQICGYDRCDGALQFHHKNPKEKSFALSAKQFIAIEKGLEEIKKCILLCANCHAEVENGVIEIGGVPGDRTTGGAF